MHLLDALNHLHGYVKDGLEVKLASTLLKQVFKRFAEEIHDHNVEHLAVFSFLVTDEVKERHVCFTAQLVNELTFPKQHDVALHAHRFLNFGGEHFTSLALFNYNQKISSRIRQGI